METLQILTLDDARGAFREEAKILSESLRSPQNQENTYLTSAGVQLELGISRATLSRWRKDKTIRFSRVDGKLFYLRSDVDELMRENLVVAD